MLLLQKAHRAAKLFCGTSDLKTYCLEACVVMVEYLHRHGQHAQLIRRNCDGYGHWTIQVNDAEYDPTCADWPDPPANSQAGTLYHGFASKVGLLADFWGKRNFCPKINLTDWTHVQRR